MSSSGHSANKWKHLRAIDLNPDNLCLGRNPCQHTLTPAQLTNGAVYEASRLMNWVTLTSMLKIWMGDRFTENTDNKKVQSVVAKLVKERLVLMKKKKSAQTDIQLQELLREPFSIPLHQTIPANTNVQPTCSEEKRQLILKVECLETAHGETVAKHNILKTEKRNAKVRERRNRKTIDLQKRIITTQQKDVTRLSKVKEMLRHQKKKRWGEYKKSRNLRIKVNKSTQCGDVVICYKCKRGELLWEEEERSNCRNISFKDGFKYNADMVSCVLALLQHNVAYSHVAPVIKSVLNLVHLTAQDLPCQSTVENIAKLKLPLAHIHIQDTVESTGYLTLYSDETSKRGQQFETFVTTDEEKKVKILGVKEIPDKSAVTILDTFKTIVHDLDSLSLSSDTGKKIVASIKNTMSDRAATEKLFQNNFAKYRVEILQKVVPNWNNLSGVEQTHLGRMHNFFCGLHLLSNAAEKVDVTLKALEVKHQTLEDDTQGAINQKCFGRSSDTVNFIRAACKAFAPGGDEKNGCFGWVSIYLKGSGESNSLTPFKGNRFNILFHNAAVLYQQRNILRKFLETCYGTPNGLLNSVLNGLKSPFLLTCCQALGFINLFLTTPLWNCIEKCENILDMNGIYSQVISNMKEVEVAKLINGDCTMIPGYFPKKTETFLAVTSGDNDDLLDIVLSSLMEELTSLFGKLLKDQLPGGINFSKTSDEFPECKSSKAHNKLPESVFGQLDQIKKTKPSASEYFIEGSIMFNFNKVGQWLDDMTKEDKYETIFAATSLKKMTIAQYKERLIVIREAKRAHLRQKQQAKQAKKQKLLNQSTELTNAVIYHGLWQTPQEVNMRLETYRLKKEKIDAVKVQINFRKKVLHQNADKKLFGFSLNKQKLTLDELAKNLTCLINEASESQTQSGDVYCRWTNKNITQSFEEAGERVDYEGRVISQVPGFPQWYNVVYDNEPDTVYTCNTLQEDFDSGDLIIHT